MNEIKEILKKEDFTKDDLVKLLSCEREDSALIFKKASDLKSKYAGKKVYLRGLIEYSNICSKNCYYCGIRAANKKLKRYQLTDDEVLNAAEFAFKNNYASIVIQSGERKDKSFISKITSLLKEIKRLSEGKLAVTLSLGEQTEDTYRLWYENGATRYLLRIETSDREHYYKIHPHNKKHDFEERMKCIYALKKIGYQVGTGVMIGLPFQTIENLAKDLLFFKEIDIDMCGMGPYIEHKVTPLFKMIKTQSIASLRSKAERFQLSLKMIALLRIMMKDINIAATTAMQTLDPQGREKAIKVGANVIMPNLTPLKYRENYLLYEDKPCLDEDAAECMNCLEARIHIAGSEIAYGEQGTSKHYKKRTKN